MVDMKKIRRSLMLVLMLTCLSFCLTACGSKEVEEEEEEVEEYVIDFCGSEDDFKGAKDSYEEGDKVSLLFDMIATDTDYSFYLDDEPISPVYDSKHNAFKISFVMPDHDVKLRVESRNSMEILSPEPGGFDTLDGENHPLKLKIDAEFIYNEDDDDYSKGYYYSSVVEFFKVDDDDHHELGELLKKRAKTKIDECRDGIYDLADAAKDAFAAEGGDEYRSYYKNRRVSLCRADEVVMSYVEYDDTFLGAGCTYTTVCGRNIDTKTGTELLLPDVITDMNGLKEVVVSKAGEDSYDPVYNGLFEKTFDEMIKEKRYASNDHFSWNICYEGLWLHFPADLPYDVQGATPGRNTMFIPFAGNEELFDERFLNVPEAYCYEIEMMNGQSDTYSLDVDGDGEYEDFMAVAIPNENDGDWIEEISVVIGDGSTAQSLTEEIWGYECSGSLVHTANNENYLYINQRQENDYESTSIYSVGTTLRYSDYLYGTIIGVYTGESDPENLSTFTDPEDFMVCDTDYKMGTFNKYAHFKVDSNGLPERKDDYWTYAKSGDLVITNKLEMKLAKVDENGNDLGFDTLKRNTKVRPYRTDDKDYLDIIDENGDIWRLTITEGPWGEDFLEEQRAEELFDGLLYAG